MGVFRDIIVSASVFVLGFAVSASAEDEYVYQSSFLNTFGNRTLLVHIRRDDGLFDIPGVKKACDGIASERVKHSTNLVVEQNHAHRLRMLSAGTETSPTIVDIEPVSVSKRGCTVVVRLGSTAITDTTDDYDAYEADFALQQDEADVFDALAFMHEVDHVEEDIPMEGLVQPTVRSWGLDRIDSDQIDNADYRPTYTGDSKGLGVVYVVDSGVRIEHVEFSGNKVTWGVDTTSGRIVTDVPATAYDTDPNGHGTHVAGTVAGHTAGVSTGAKVVAVRVLDSYGKGSTAKIVMALKWAYEYHNATFPNNRWPAVVSMSLGGSKSSVLNAAVIDFIEDGEHIVVMAAGNDNIDACSVSPASSSADSKYAISVGSITRTDARSDFSNYGDGCVDIFAPGSEIVSADSGSNTGYTTMSGTSMAAPHVSGVLMQYLEKHNGDRDAAVSDMLYSVLPPTRISNSLTPGAGILQTVEYTGPPTPPTLSPTMPPTFPEAGPATLCAYPEEVWCVPDNKISFARFGPKLEFDESLTILGNRDIGIAYTGPDEYLCGADTDHIDLNWHVGPKGIDDKIVVVVPRGGCIFNDKINTAIRIYGIERLVAVIYVQLSGESVFPPAYYGTDEVTVPSLMIDSSVLSEIYTRMDPDGVRVIGRPPVPGKVYPTKAPTTFKIITTKSPTPTPNTPIPTTRPTTARPSQSPTQRPTTARKTRRPTTSRPTKSPTTPKPTTPKPTLAPTSINCSVISNSPNRHNWQSAEAACVLEGRTLCTQDQINTICGGFQGVSVNANPKTINGFWVKSTDNLKGDENALRKGRYPFWIFDKQRVVKRTRAETFRFTYTKGIRRNTGVLCCE